MPIRSSPIARKRSLSPSLSSSCVSGKYSPANIATVFQGDCIDLLSQIPNRTAQLVVTSPPYNIGKEYERRTDVASYVRFQEQVIKECVRILADDGSLCWQVGNFVDSGTIIPIDILLYPVFERLGLKLRNRIIWHFEHGLHCSRRFSGRYETIMWFTRSDSYFFNVDPVRVPQKYPGKKYFKGPRAGEYSCNPLGKNPGDLWVIPNVKHNHVEKTDHPCQFPVELIERLVLSMTESGRLVVDPFLGVGSSAIAAVLHNRKAAGAEIVPAYCSIAKSRIELASAGLLKTRPLNREVHEPSGKVATRPAK